MKTEETNHSTDQIQALSAEEWIQKMLVDKAKVDLLYVIIGYLQEYFGGYALDEKVVETFYPGETQKAMTFSNICKAYLKAQQLEDDTDLVMESNGRSYVKSKNICSKLKAHYVNALPPFLNHQCYQLAENDDLFKPAEALPDSVQWFNIKQYSFLLGIFTRYQLQDKNMIVFANAAHKAEMAIKFLKGFDAFGGNTFSVKYNFGSPESTSIEIPGENLFWRVTESFAISVLPSKN